MDYEFPDDLKYTPTHEWVRIKDKVGTVGITDFAQHQLGDVVFVEFPKVGMAFEKGNNAGEIESVKAVSDLIMPLSGKIIEINERIVSNPELINSSPFDDGWLIKIEISHPDEIDELLPADKYTEIVQKDSL